MGKSSKQVVELIQSIKLDPSIIIRLQGEANYTRIYTTQKSYIVARTLKMIHERLIKHGFIRVHKGHCVNINHIKGIVYESRTLIMSNDDKVIVARRMWPDTLDYLSQFFE
jgi:DNA-binding LytR/AlgR family response regulator